MTVSQHDHPDPPAQAITARLNWLRAGVLGANDGIVSTAGLVLGVAGATPSTSALLTAGVAGLVSGALSMAAGEYVSVSTQRDTEAAAVAHERDELARDPAAELDELQRLIAARGVSPELARLVAEQLSRRDPLAAHAALELGIRPGEYASPLSAALASALSFAVGALVPLGAVLLSPLRAVLPVTLVAVIAALFLTGVVSARLGNAPASPAVLRNVAGGVLAGLVTYGIGRLVGTHLA